MHRKVFLKLKNPKNSLFWATILKKNQKKQKNKKNKKKNKKKKKKIFPKNPLGWFFLNRFFLTLAACTNISLVEDGGEAVG
jgi:hypothetical protein